MRRQLDMIGSGRFWRGVLGVSALALMSGCSWLGWDSSPANSQKARPGADRQVGATGALPSANPGRQHEPGVAASDPVQTPQIGSVVAAKGGQKAQKESADKEANERDAKEREAREKRDAAEREAKAKEPPPPPRTNPAGSLPGRPAAAEPANAEPAARAAPSVPGAGAPAAPVTAAPRPAPPPATEAAPPPVAEPGAPPRT